MTTSVPGGLAALVLAAGAGTRLRPLTRRRPKVLCPVGSLPLVDHGLARVERIVGRGPDVVAVNVHHGADSITDHVQGRAHVSHEVQEALGTAGGVAHLARSGWLAGRHLLVVNGDAWTTTALDSLVEGWDGERIRVATAGPGPVRAGVKVAGALMPAEEIARLQPVPSGLWGTSWRPALDAGRLDAVAVDGAFVDCGTPADYLAANLAVSRGASVVGDGAVVDGEVVRSVVWDGSRVGRGERLVDAIRADDLTVLVRTPGG